MLQIMNSEVCKTPLNRFFMCLGMGFGCAICRLIDALLPKGYPAIKDVAALLGVSVRSLQRVLHEAGVSFRTWSNAVAAAPPVSLSSFRRTRFRILLLNLGTAMPAVSRALFGAGRVRHHAISANSHSSGLVTARCSQPVS